MFSWDIYQLISQTNLSKRLSRQKFEANLLLFFNSNISGSTTGITENQSQVYEDSSPRTLSLPISSPCFIPFLG